MMKGVFRLDILYVNETILMGKKVAYFFFFQLMPIFNLLDYLIF